MLTLPVVALAKAEFAPFGEVIETDYVSIVDLLHSTAGRALSIALDYSNCRVGPVG